MGNRRFENVQLRVALTSLLSGLVLSGCVASHVADGDPGDGRASEVDAPRADDGRTTASDGEGPGDEGVDDPPEARPDSDHVLPGALVSGCRDLCARMDECNAENYDDCIGHCHDTSHLNASDRCDDLLLDVIACFGEQSCMALWDGAPWDCQPELVTFERTCTFAWDRDDAQPAEPPPEPSAMRACLDLCDHVDRCESAETDCLDGCYGAAGRAQETAGCEALFFDIGDCLTSLSCRELEGRYIDETTCRPLFDAWDERCVEPIEPD